MSTEQRKSEIKQVVTELLQEAHESMLAKIDRAINSGAIDLDAWEDKPMIIPKTITIALLENAPQRFSPLGTSYDKWIKKNVKNLKIFI